MATPAMKAKLDKARKLFSKAKEVSESSGNADLPDAAYKARVIDAKGPVESKNKGTLQAMIQFEICAGEYKGEKVMQFSNLENEVGMGILIRTLNMCGYDVEDFDGIEAALLDLKKDKPMLRIVLKTKGEYQNINVNKLLTGDEGDDDDTSSSGDATPEDVKADEPTADVGSKVTFKNKGKDMEGEIVEIVDEDTVRVKAEDGKTYKLAADKIELVAEDVKVDDATPEDVTPEDDVVPEDPANDDAVTLEEGSKVTFKVKGADMEGEIIEIVDDDTVRVKAEDGKTYKLGTDKIEAAPAKKEKPKVKKVIKK